MGQKRIFGPHHAIFIGLPQHLPSVSPCWRRPKGVVGVRTQPVGDKYRRYRFLPLQGGRKGRSVRFWGVLGAYLACRGGKDRYLRFLSFFVLIGHGSDNWSRAGREIVQKSTSNQLYGLQIMHISEISSKSAVLPRVHRSS